MTFDASSQPHGQTRSVLDTAGPSVFPGGRVLIVDDQAGNLALLSRLLVRDGHTVLHARSGEEALDLVAREQPDLVLLDVMMPAMNGFDVCRRLKNERETRLTPVVLVTALQQTRDKIEGIEAGADDFLTKPVNPHELRARVRSLLRIKRYTDDLESAESVILSLALTIEARDAYTDGHCHRLAAYASALGRAIGLGEDDIGALERGGFLHDVGKVGVPDALLLKPGPLTPDEYEIIKRHTIIGDALCGELRSLKRVRPIVRHHHERLDGSGYPDGLRGEQVPLLAQIMSIVDLFDAVTTSRPYKEAEPTESACEALQREVGLGWRRADLVDAFISLVRRDELPRFSAGVPAGGRLSQVLES
jgi:putative two-component system response regulator